MPACFCRNYCCWPIFAFGAIAGCPRVWRDGAVLKTDPQPNLQWYKDGQPIPGATGTEITPDGPGAYRVGAAAERVPFVVEEKTKYVLIGGVTDEFMRPIANATVSVEGLTAQTDADGRFTITGVPRNNPRTVVRAEAADYIRVTRGFLPTYVNVKSNYLFQSIQVTKTT